MPLASLRSPSNKSDNIPARSSLCSSPASFQSASRLYYWLRHLLALLIGSREFIILCLICKNSGKLHIICINSGKLHIICINSTKLHIICINSEKLHIICINSGKVHISSNHVSIQMFYLNLINFTSIVKIIPLTTCKMKLII